MHDKTHDDKCEEKKFEVDREKTAKGLRTSFVISSK